MGPIPTPEILGVPAEISSALMRLRDELASAAGVRFAGLILYGGLARGRYRPGRSDVNVVVLLNDASVATLDAIAPALRAARRAAMIEPMILTPDEVRRSADAFPTKFLDIQRHHVVLAGENPFVGLEVPREAVRLRVEQELRNLTLRLRRRYANDGIDSQSMSPVLEEVARPLAIALESLLRLAGREVPGDDRSATIFEAAAEAFHLDAPALARLAALRRDAGPEQDLTELFGRVLQTVAQAAELADGMEGGR